MNRPARFTNTASHHISASPVRSVEVLLLPSLSFCAQSATIVESLGEIWVQADRGVVVLARPGRIALCLSQTATIVESIGEVGIQASRPTPTRFPKRRA